MELLSKEVSKELLQKKRFIKVLIHSLKITLSIINFCHL